MMLKVFSIFDSKVAAYLQPFFMRTKGEAIRAFTASLADPSSNFCKYPGDYTLFELGSYDDSTAEFVLNDSPVNLGVALEFLSSNLVPGDGYSSN